MMVANGGLHLFVRQEVSQFVLPWGLRLPIHIFISIGCHLFYHLYTSGWVGTSEQLNWDSGIAQWWSSGLTTIRIWIRVIAGYRCELIILILAKKTSLTFTKKWSVDTARPMALHARALMVWKKRYLPPVRSYEERLIGNCWYYSEYKEAKEWNQYKAQVLKDSIQNPKHQKNHPSCEVSDPAGKIVYKCGYKHKKILPLIEAAKHMTGAGRRTKYSEVSSDFTDDMYRQLHTRGMMGM